MPLDKMLTWACENPSVYKEMAQINSISGWTQATGRKCDFRHAGKHWQSLCTLCVALGLMVMKSPKLLFNFNSVDPSYAEQ